MDQVDFESRAARIEPLVERAAALADPEARAVALDLLRGVLDVHGAVFARIIELLVEAGEPGRQLLADCGNDPLIGGMLVLYGLHPLDFETRVRQAVGKVESRLKERGLNVARLEVQSDAVELTLAGAAQGCGGHAGAVSHMVEEAIREAAPDASGVHIELNTPGQPPAGFVPLSALLAPAQEKRQYEKSTA